MIKKTRSNKKSTKLGSSLKPISRTDLWETIIGGTLADVKQLAQSGANLNKSTADGFTALMLAIGRGKPKLTAYLIERGADVNARNNIGQTPLMMAAGGGHTTIVKQLIAAGADIHINDDDKRNAIAWAISREDFPEVVAMLGKAGGNYDAASDRGITPLIRTALMGFSKSARVLLELGADEAIKFNGKTAYEIASDKGQNKVCREIESALHKRKKKDLGFSENAEQSELTSFSTPGALFPLFGVSTTAITYPIDATFASLGWLA